MKNRILSLIIIAIGFKSNAQVPNHHWSNAADGGALAKGYCITVDNVGNVYTAGIFGSTNDFNPSSSINNLTSNGSDDIFIVKTTPQGDFVWARNLGGTQSDVPKDITVDLSGNIYLTGYFAGTADFDPEAGVTNLVSAGGDDAFITKLNSSGQLIWAKNIGGATNDTGNAIDIDDFNGAVYVIGSFTGTADFDPSIPTTMNVLSNGSNDIFMLKLSSIGNYITSKTIGGNGSDRGNDIVVDATTGDQFMTGSFGNTVDFDPGLGIASYAGGSQDIFVLKFDVDNNFAFVKKMGGIAVDEGRNIDIDANGFIYVNGSFISTCNFDPNGGTTNVTSNGSDDVFVMQLLPSGALNWVRTFGSVGTEDFMDMDVNSFGDIYITGEMANDMDANPDPIIVNTLTKLGAEDAYIVALGSDGGYYWSTSYGANSISAYTRGFGIFADEINNIYSTGSFQSTVDFNPSAATTTITAVAGSDIYYQKLGPGTNTNGITEEVQNKTFTVSPNPSNGIFTLHSPQLLQNAEITVTDVRETVLQKFQKTTLNEVTINLEHHNCGIYFIEIHSESFKEIIKVIKN
jgi:hypothetical protein